MRIRQRIADLFVTKHRQSIGYSNLRFRCRTIREYGTVLSVSFCLLLSSSPSSAQTLEWAKQAGGTGLVLGRAIAVDTSGNSYVTGRFNGIATFGTGEAIETTLVSVFSDNIFIAKYAGNGDLVWVKQAGSPRVGDSGQGIAVDTSGNCYVTGRFSFSATFGAGEPNQTTLVSIGADDIFVAKYAGNGDLVWAKQAGVNRFNDEGSGIAVDASGNSYVTGFFQLPATFGLGEPNETTLVSTGPPDIFVAKYASNGDLVWATQAGGTSSERSHGIAVDTSGNSYVTGIFNGSAIFGAEEPNETTLDSPGDDDIFVAKYAGNGDLVWAKQAGGTSSGDDVQGIAVDTSGNSYVTGRFVGSATFGAGETNETTLVSAGPIDIFVAKYADNGDLLWAKQASGTGSTDHGLGIAVDTSGNCHVTGRFNGSATFGAGEPNETTLSSLLISVDIFVAKYAGNGDLVWATQADGTRVIVGVGIGVDTSGNSYVTGAFQGSATFGAGEPNETTLDPVGSVNNFVAKFSVETDSDGDGVNDFVDVCLNSDLRSTIVIGGIDTGVENDLLDDGCTIADLIDAIVTANPSSVDVVQFLVDLKAEGIITGRDLGAILQGLNSP